MKRQLFAPLAAIILTVAASVSGVAVLTAASPVLAAEKPSKDWSSLTRLVGQYPYDSKLFTASPISKPLKALLGRKFRTFIANTNVQTPLDADGDVLFVSGNAAHSGGSDGAYLLIDIRHKTIEVGLWEEKKFSSFKSGGEIRKPKDIQAMFEIYAP